jgi:transposase InsO family protein
VGSLLASPPARGDLKAELVALSHKQWRHPITGKPVCFGVSTIERWLYTARCEARDPIGVLRRKVRKDAGLQPGMGNEIRKSLLAQYRAHGSWSYKLHFDNMAVLVEKDPGLSTLPSYSTLVRYMKAHGLVRTRRLGPRNSPGANRAQERLETREVRSYEAEYVHGLWHTDYHSGSLKVLTASGQWQIPFLLAVLDDRSRLCCHAQWYLEENTETFVHGLSQALQKRDLPRALMSDNGSPMIAAETVEGLSRLSITHETTLPYSPYQNAKQEVFWAQVEGRLVSMLEGVADKLTLRLLNEATQAWVEMEYNRNVHSETHETPLARFLAGPHVGRACPPSQHLRDVFTMHKTRTQRRSDGTVTVEGVRFELPSRLRHLLRVAIRYARWDLSYVLIVDDRAGTVLGRIYPLDKTRNSDGVRRSLEPIEPDVKPATGMAPLLEKLMEQYSASGLPPAYLLKEDSK